MEVRKYRSPEDGRLEDRSTEVRKTEVRKTEVRKTEVRKTEVRKSSHYNKKAKTRIAHELIMAQRIKSVEVCNLGSSVVAGLVPATNPWYGIFPTHQRD